MRTLKHMRTTLRQLFSVVFVWFPVAFASQGILPATIFAYVYTQSLIHIDNSTKGKDPGLGSCIPSGDHTDIQNALTDIGSAAVLCPGAVFELGESINFTADSQSIYTEGFPTDSTRALLKVAHQDVVTAIEPQNWSYLTLSHVIIDGNRPEFGVGYGALIEWGSSGTGNVVEWVRAYEPWGWSVIHIGEGDDLQCDGAVIRYNEFGPSGRAEYGLGDGISLACRNSVVEHNTIVDVTDGGIVVFQAPGSPNRR